MFVRRAAVATLAAIILGLNASSNAFALGITQNCWITITTCQYVQHCYDLGFFGTWCSPPQKVCTSYTVPVDCIGVNPN